MRCIIIGHEISDEVECGYKLTIRRFGGNFYGVCLGLDLGDKFDKSTNLSKAT